MITIVKNKKKTFDLFDPKKQLKITDDFFEKIIETKYFFIVYKDKKYGVYNRKGGLIENLEYNHFEITGKSNSIILSIHNLSGSNKIILSKNISCRDRFLNYQELHSTLKDKSQTLILVFGDNQKKYFRLWNTKRGYIFHPCNDIKVLTNKTLKCKIAKNNFLVNYSGKRIVGKRFIEIFGYIGGASLALTSNKTGLINISGEWINGFDDLIISHEIWYVYLNCLERNYKLLPFQKDDLFGLINYNENLVFEPISSCPIIFYKEDKPRSRGFAKVTINGLSGIIDEKLNWVVDPLYEEFIDSFIFEGFTRSQLTHRCIPYIVKSPNTKKYGLLSYRGKWIYPPIYNKIKQGFEDGIRKIYGDYFLIFENYRSIRQCY